MAQETPADWRFLFRQDQGEISRAVWLRGVGMLAAPLLVLTGGWLLLLPYANRGLDQRGLVDPLAFVTYFYLAGFAFVVILIAVSFYNLSAKRFRARGLAPPFGGLVPFAALIAGAAHWLQPRVADVLPRFAVLACDVAAVAIALWCLYELGLRDDRGDAP
jgi:hypothetical protein